MSFYPQEETYSGKQHYVSLRGRGDAEEFRKFVQQYLADHRNTNAQFADSVSWKDVMTPLCGGEFLVMIVDTPSHTWKQSKE